MENKTILEISEIYDIEIDRIVNTIKKQKAGKILLQFPEGMKPDSTTIADEVEERSNCQCFIWMGSCFGACDIPLEVEKLGVDLIIQFGHSAWNYNKKEISELN